MKVTTLLKTALLLAGSLVLAACGGGGGSGDDSGFNPPGINVTASAASNSVQSGRNVNITVTVRQASGTAITDGTTVNAVVAPANIGSIVAIGPNGPTGNATAQTVGGVANFRFTGSTVGNATVTFSVPDPNAPARNVTASVVIAVSQGIDRLTMEATTTTLPVNIFNVLPFVGSPYLAEVTITLRTASGELVNQPDGVQVSVNPVGDTGGFSTLDDPETEDDNEFQIRLGQGPVDVVAGKATVFMHSLNFSGQTTMTVTGQDPETSETVSTSLVFNIVSTTPPLPSAVTISPTTAPQYVQSSGGNSAGQFEVRVDDGIGQPVPNPVAGSNAFNNVRIELIGDSNGARLSGVSASGQSVSGAAIAVRTQNGITGGSLVSGDIPGLVRIRATSDRADNNVDNGISDPVVGERSIMISDGLLFDLDLTVPNPGLIVNRVSESVEAQTDEVPPDPDGTYSLIISAIATDRQGNPVIPGTLISFGLIDEPQETGLDDFFIVGLDGNPQEGGRTFTAPTGRFTTAGGGVGPGDTLIVFGEEVIGNRDHESARRVSSVTSATSLMVDRRFNNNDTTGSIVNSGAILPYVIGRAADGNIVASGTTDENGVVTVKMNYPVRKLGKGAIIWAQGDGDLVNGTPETVGDVEFAVFAGLAPATLVVSPGTIPGNTTIPLTACVFDALGAPIAGVGVGFEFEFEGGGQGSIDGTPSAGAFANPTDFSGCTVGQATTSAVLDGGTINFSAAGATDSTDITIGELVLTANPQAFFGGGGTTTLRLVDESGNPVSGVQLSGTCTGEGGALLTTAPTGGSGVTDGNGEARFTITATNLNQAGSAGSGTCTYEVPGGTPSTDVIVQGVDICEALVSPLPPGCSTTPPTLVTLTLNLVGAGAGTSATAVSSPSGIACTKPDGASFTCSASFEQGSDVIIAVTPQPNDPVDGARRVEFTGDCVGAPVFATGDAGATRNATVAMSAARTCTATISPP